MTNDPIVTIEHVRACGLCVRGIRGWAERYGLDFAHFLQHGYPASVIESTGDHFGLQVVAKAREAISGKAT